VDGDAVKRHKYKGAVQGFVVEARGRLAGRALCLPGSIFKKRGHTLEKEH
jgi:hypothetical protein